ncbi:hypothetical protein [Cryobacterium glucosi]|uniref:DUF4439 domain-containing protein n=1 Tax=Cryobacterium glucosi TaxID=1259175 RepID=A0ABY2IMZ5_9MICO|nr:hypothetical protein [Cryobacterium glucosi]TFC20853.1 hypothetical protein E3O46_07925 [Cryobacterium glucosi]
MRTGAGTDTTSTADGSTVRVPARSRKQRTWFFLTLAVGLATLLTAGIGIPLTSAEHDRVVAENTKRATLAATAARAVSELAALRTEVALFVLPLDDFDRRLVGVVDPALIAQLNVARDRLGLAAHGGYPRAIAEAHSVVVRRLQAIAEAEATAAETAVGVQTAADQNARDAVTAAVLKLRAAAITHGELPKAFTAVVVANAALTANQAAAVAATQAAAEAAAAEAARVAAATAARNSGTSRTSGTSRSSGSSGTGSTGGTTSGSPGIQFLPHPTFLDPPVVHNNANYQSMCQGEAFDDIMVEGGSSYTFDYDFAYSYIVQIAFETKQWDLTVFACL